MTGVELKVNPPIDCLESEAEVVVNFGVLNENPDEATVVVTAAEAVAGVPNENPEADTVVVLGVPKENPEAVEEVFELTLKPDATGDAAAPPPNLNPPPAPIVITGATGLAASFNFLTSSSHPGLGPSQAKHWILLLSFLVRQPLHSQLLCF